MGRKNSGGGIRVKESNNRDDGFLKKLTEEIETEQSKRKQRSEQKTIGEKIFEVISSNTP